MFYSSLCSPALLCIHSILRILRLFAQVLHVYLSKSVLTKYFLTLKVLLHQAFSPTTCNVTPLQDKLRMNCACHTPWATGERAASTFCNVVRYIAASHVYSETYFVINSLQVTGKIASCNITFNFLRGPAFCGLF